MQWIKQERKTASSKFKYPNQDNDNQDYQTALLITIPVSRIQGIQQCFTKSG